MLSQIKVIIGAQEFVLQGHLGLHPSPEQENLQHAHAQENAPAPKRSGRRRGAPAKALDPIAEEAQPEEDARPEPEATMEAEAEPAPLTVPELNVQESAPLGNVATGKPPLPGRPRGGRAAKDEQGMVYKATLNVSSRRFSRCEV